MHCTVEQSRHGGSKPKITNFSWNSFNWLVFISKNWAADQHHGLASMFPGFESDWTCLGRAVRKRLTLHNITQHWKNGYAFHNAIFKFSSIVCDAVVRHVEMLVVVPQDIDQIKWCLLKNNSCFIKNEGEWVAAEICDFGIGPRCF